MKKSTLLLLAVFLISSFALAGDRDKPKKGSSRVVDSGSFGIFLNGKRIATEKFHIEQSPEAGTINSQFSVDDGNNKAEQSAEMQVAPSGELIVYKWKATVPEKEETVVEPKEQFLIEHLITSDQKKRDVPYILPLTTVILDDNFFSHRELLVWRYLASGCVPVPVKPGQNDPKNPPEKQLGCAPSHFGVLVPRQHLAASTVVELVGREKINFKSAEIEVNKIKMDADGIQWFIWVDDDYKVVKMSIPSNNVEVVRD